MNKTKEMLEIIDGFQNLTSKIKDDHDSIKKALKNKELTIAACKSEYKKLYNEHEQLKKKYSELEAEYEKSKEKNKDVVEKIRKRKQTASEKIQKKKIILDYDSDAENEKSSSEDEKNDENDYENDYEIIKVKKKNKKK